MMMWMADYFIVALALATGTHALCPSGCICNTTQQYTRCHGAGLRAIPWNLPGPIELKILDLSGNNIHELLSGIYTYGKLEVLDLSDCDIRKINYGVFESLTNLKKLNLRNNRIELSKGMFAGLHSLEELDLSGNRISSIPEETFSELSELRQLNLSSNMLNLYPDTFRGLYKLQSLSLAKNHLYATPTEALQHVPNLITLDLSRNSISGLEKDSFDTFNILQTLFLADNKIRSVDEGVFEGLSTSLYYLDLQNNSLDRIPSEALQKARMLMSLDLSQNFFSVIDPDTFKDMDKLRVIFLHSLPNLMVVRSYAFSELESLEKVDLHSNPLLHTIEEFAFLGTTHLKYLNLHGNDLRTLSEGLIQWNRLEVLDLDGNSWHCDCHLQFVTGLKTLVDVRSNESVLCALPTELAGMPVTSIESSHFLCDVQMKKMQNEQFQDSIMIAIIAGIAGILLIVMCVLMMNSRHTFFGTSYQMQVSYHEYHMPTATIGTGVPNGAVPSRPRSSRRLYRPGQAQRQFPELVRSAAPGRPPPPRVVRQHSTISTARNPSLAIIEEEEDRLSVTDHEENISQASGENLV